MRVAVDAHTLGSGQGGDETMLGGVLVGLSETKAPEDVFPLFVASDGVLPEAVAGRSDFPVVQRMQRLPGVAHFPVRMPWLLYRNRRALAAELIFAVNHGPVVSPVPVVLMIQDLSFFHRPDFYPLTDRIRLNQVMRRQALRARAVATVSEFCRNDIIETFGVAGDRVFTIPNAITEPPPFDEADRAAGTRWLKEKGVDGPFVLYLGNLHPRKNLPRLIRAFLRAKDHDSVLEDCKLVIAGARWWGEGAEERAATERPDEIVLLGRISALEREWCMRLATAMAYVSLFEGFGLPPLEAMIRGTPVLTSNVTSLPEVTGEASLQVDPLDEDAIADGLIKVVSDEVLRSDLIDRGLDQARTFNTRRTGEAAMRAFHAAVALN
ncbi:MAG: hypothetical protein JJLCMIEE_02675 [Acidimicrobiales bacterium]|nr:MAG: glycosyltransferase family 1 protein [Actinomycetota bacterium]MBV6509581.1 hypothetical protein [Acidimicrobiales bacterium]RIK06557.1 MAG: hypothetical protein DCC48_06490 [Acidobacteriota bacterium]